MALFYGVSFNRGAGTRLSVVDLLIRKSTMVRSIKYLFLKADTIRIRETTQSVDLFEFILLVFIKT
jgi:hypothetical protein